MLLAALHFLSLCAAISGGLFFALVAKGQTRLLGVVPLTVWVAGFFLPMLYVYFAPAVDDPVPVVMASLIVEGVAGVLGLVGWIKAMTIHAGRLLSGDGRSARLTSTQAHRKSP